MRFVVIVAASILLAALLRAWRNLPSPEFPANGVHAPRHIHDNRGDRR